MRNSIADVALIDVPVVNKAGAALSPYFGDVARGAQNSLEEATMTCVRYWVFSILATAVLSSQSFAQVTFVNLHPAGASGPSQAFGVHNGQQVGQVNNSQASLWNGTAASWISINPAGSSGAEILDVDNGQQVGVAGIGGVERAGLWSGTAASWVDLNPVGSVVSRAFGVHNGQQVGAASVGGANRASLWTGTAASWVNLHPAGAGDSAAYGVHSGQQVGFATIGGANHASIWNGTAASWLDIHPAGATASSAYDTQNGQQVGHATVGGQFRGSLWSGTSASWVDLTPVGATASGAFGIHDGYQAGFATFGGQFRAGMWNGTAASWTDLHAALTGSWGNTVAENIWSDASLIYVVGYGFNNSTGRNEALLWTQPIPEPSSILLASLVSVPILRRFRKRAS